MSNRFMRRPEVEKVTGLAPSTIYLHVRKGSFPRPIQISPNAVGWLEAEVLEWLKSRIAARDQSERAA